MNKSPIFVIWYYFWTPTHPICLSLNFFFCTSTQSVNESNLMSMTTICYWRLSTLWSLLIFYYYLIPRIESKLNFLKFSKSFISNIWCVGRNQSTFELAFQQKIPNFILFLLNICALKKVKFLAPSCMFFFEHWVWFPKGLHNDTQCFWRLYHVLNLKNRLYLIYSSKLFVYQ